MKYVQGKENRVWVTCGDMLINYFELKERILMNIEKVFARMLKAKAKGVDVSVVTDYENTKELIKYALAMPDTYIVDIEIGEILWKGYGDVYTLNLGSDGSIYCEPSVRENGGIGRGAGLYLIDVVAIGEWLPSDFVLDDPSTEIKLIGGDD